VVAPPNHWSTRNIVGASLLVKAVDQPAKILDVLPSSRASPLPQGFCGTTKSLVNTEHCGSEPARESAGSAGKDVECTAVFASRPAPTEVVAPPNHWSTRNTVGASLLAKAVVQANMKLNVTPPSRAGPLPQRL
jgi:hypothetical protein